MRLFVSESLILVILAVTLGLLGCCASSVVEDADEQGGVEEIVIQEEELVTAEKQITWVDVAAGIRENLSEHWVLSDVALYDPANVIFRLATKMGKDPVIMGYEMGTLSRNSIPSQILTLC